MMTMTASEVLAAFWDGKLPVDLHKIAQGLNTTLVASNTLGSLSGKVEWQDDKPLVTYNATESLMRQRFTVAHELGHVALGHLHIEDCLLRDSAANFSTGASAPIEREANTFAAQLLMPASVVRYAVNEKRMLDVSSLSQAFAVSQVAMKFRLQNLGLLRA